MNRLLIIFLTTCSLIGSSLYSSGLAEEQNFDKTITSQGIVFHITCPNNSSLNDMEMEVSGPKTEKKTIRRKIDGSIVQAVSGDLDKNGLPEIYIFISSAGSGSYGDVIAYSVTGDGSLQAITLAPLSDDPQNREGYMGHDTFSLNTSTLVRTFPVYKKGDPNAAPSGGTRQIRYSLVNTDKGFLLRPVCISKQ